jgi:hypothetical protein
MTEPTYEELVAAQHAGRYPNYVTFAWQRSDGDYEIVGTLNGETIEEAELWNSTVRIMLTLLRFNDNDTQAYHREDVVSVWESGDNEDDWKPINLMAIT